MAIIRRKLTRSEEQMMDIFWSSAVPLTTVDIVNMRVRDTWGSGLVHNIVRSLVKKGFLEECGMERYKTQYARKLKATFTKEEYIAKLMVLKFGEKFAFPKMLSAMAKEKKAREKEEMIEELEEIIRQLRELAAKEAAEEQQRSVST